MASIDQNFFKYILLVLLTLFSCNKIFDPVTGQKGTFVIHEISEPFTWSIDSIQSDFNSLISIINNETDSIKKQALVDSFISSNIQNGFPYVEENILAHFIYYDSSFTSATVNIKGDFNKWEMNNWGIDPITFKNLEKTNLYYYSRIFEPDARIEYKLRINGIWKRDPLNPYTFGFGDFSINSELAMPLYDPPPEVESYDIPHGTVKSIQYLAPNYSTARSVWVYLPPDYNNSIKYPSVYFHDGGSYLTQGQTKNILDYLIYHNQIEPVVAIFVNPLSRNYEYLYNEEFASMFSNHLVSYIDKRYNTDPSPESRAIIGYSFGGIVSLFMTLRHHDVFGNCAAYSPALHSGDLVDQYINHPYFEAKFYLDAGTYEDWLYEPTLRLANDLSKKGYDGHFYSWPEYHSMGSWRAHLDNALTYFFPGK